MPRLKIDEVKQLSEPIIIDAGILSEKEYRVEKVTTDLLKEVNKQVSEKGAEDSMDYPIRQLALLVGVPATEFEKVDLRVVGRVLDFIMDEITKGIKSKNPTAAGAKQ
jgi:hypothetical protein